jgi:hypothetical protein
MTRAEYEAIDAVHFSTLKEFARSPAHYKAALQSPKEATDAMEIGTAYHLLALEPERVSERIAVWRGETRKGPEWNDFCDERLGRTFKLVADAVRGFAAAGKVLLSAEDFETAKAMAASVRASPQAKPYLATGMAEVTLQWEEQGIKCKGRADFVGSALVDLKSTRSAAMEPFGKQMWDARVHAQLAFYRSGLGKPLPCVLIATENVFPYVTQVYRLTEAQLEQGRGEYSAWLATLKQCEATKHYPGYWPTETELVFPKWTNPEVIYE